MNTTGKVTKVTLAQHVRDLIAGTQKHSPNGQLTLGGEAFTAQTLIQTLQSLGDALSTGDTAKASWQDALKNLADVKAKVRPLLGAYRSWVVATHGNAPATLADFGITPPKARTPLSADQKAAAVAKRKATRAARHTLGPKQKKGIKGTVLATAPQNSAPPATVPATPSTATTPAAPAPKAGG
jgi:hypothetical protein